MISALDLTLTASYCSEFAPAMINHDPVQEDLVLHFKKCETGFFDLPLSTRPVASRMGRESVYHTRFGTGALRLSFLVILCPARMCAITHGIFDP